MSIVHSPIFLIRVADKHEVQNKVSKHHGLTVRLKVVRCFETTVTIDDSTGRNIPEDLNLH